MQFKQYLIPITVAAAMGAGYSPLLAADNNVLEEVLVTATKRTQSVQDVPLALQVLTTETLEDMGADNIDDYFRTISSLSVVDKGPGTKKYAIRGTSTGVYSESAATVGVYIDEMPVSLAGDQPDIKLFDVARVEVLKGPQGTLYGEGSMGGTIKTITNKPDLSTFSGKVAASISDTTDGSDNSKLNAMLNIPLIEDTFALRLVAYNRDMSGFIDRIAQPDGITLDPNWALGLPTGFFPIYNTGPIAARDNINDEETNGGRVSALWQVTDKLAISANYLTQSMDVGAWSYENMGAGEYNSNFAVEEGLSDDIDLGNITIEYSFENFDLLSSSSWFNREKHDEQNTSLFTELVFWPGVIAAGSGTLNDFDMESFSQEVRFTSAHDGPFQWLVGGFYFDGDLVDDQSFKDDFGFFLDFMNDTGFPFLSMIGAIPPGITIPSLDPLLNQTITTELEQKALFGELSYDLSEQLTATLGLRYFDIEHTVTVVNHDGNILGFGLADGVYPGDETGTTLKFHLGYHLNDDVLLYAQAVEGFRAGGVNIAPLIDPSLAAFDSDSLWSYEVGAKTAWMDNRLIFDVAAYYIDWSDIQLSVPVGVTRLTLNSGEARMMGVELDLIVRPITGLDLRFTAGFVEAELTKDTPDADTDDVTPGFKGDRLPMVPEVNLSASAQYEFPIEALGVNGFARADYTYTGDSNTTFNNRSISNGGESNFFVNGSYSLLNLKLGIRTDNWQATLFVDNATDERAELLIDNNAAAELITRNRPRTTGVAVQYQF